MRGTDVHRVWINGLSWTPGYTIEWRWELGVSRRGRTRALVSKIESNRSPRVLYLPPVAVERTLYSKNISLDIISASIYSPAS